MAEGGGTSPAGELGELEAIIEALRNTRGEVPVDAIEAACQNPEAITPLLIRLIEDATRDRQAGVVTEDNGYFFATYLLADFRATEAWPAVVAALSLSDPAPFDLYGDAITDEFDYIFSALVGDRSDALDALIVDTQINHYVRWQAVDAMLHQIYEGVLTRDLAVERLTAHLQWAIEQHDELVEPIIFTLEDLGASSALPLIESAFEKGLADPQMLSLVDIREHMADGDKTFRRSMENLRRPKDVVTCLQQWFCRTEDEEDDVDALEIMSLDDHDDYDDFDYEYDDDDEPLPENETTVRNEAERIGRNDPCPCFSGKKYKKCCGKP